MTTREDAVKMLQENPRQQDMLNYLLSEIAKSARDNFPAFIKMVQMDVASALLNGPKKDQLVGAKLPELTAAIDELMQQVGKDIETRIQAQYLAEKAEMDRCTAG